MSLENDEPKMRVMIEHNIYNQYGEKIATIYQQHYDEEDTVTLCRIETKYSFKLSELRKVTELMEQIKGNK